MNGFSAALRQAMHCRRASAAAARRRLAKARTGSAKNITPKRDTMASTLAGSNGCSCASALTNSAATPARSARLRAAASIGAETSTPTHRLPGPSRPAMASVVAPVPQPTSSTARGPRAAIASTSRCSKGAYRSSSSACPSTQARPAAPFHNAVCWFSTGWGLCTWMSPVMSGGVGTACHFTSTRGQAGNAHAAPFRPARPPAPAARGQPARRRRRRCGPRAHRQGRPARR